MTHQRKSRKFYEEVYRDALEEAFARKPFRRRRLLRAVRLYNEDHYRQALRILYRLRRKCREIADTRAVLLFTGLCYTDMKLPRKATDVYRLLLEIDPWNVKANNNLGYQLYCMGVYGNALELFDRAITADPDYAPAYLNTANCWFRQNDLDRAMIYAEMALERDPHATSAMSLLAIVHALKGNEEEKAEYVHRAVEAGYPEEKLKQAIRVYQNAQKESERNEEA